MVKDSRSGQSLPSKKKFDCSNNHSQKLILYISNLYVWFLLGNQHYSVNICEILPSWFNNRTVWPLEGNRTWMTVFSVKTIHYTKPCSPASYYKVLRWHKHITFSLPLLHSTFYTLETSSCQLMVYGSHRTPDAEILLLGRIQRQSKSAQILMLVYRLYFLECFSQYYVINGSSVCLFPFFVSSICFFCFSHFLHFLQPCFLAG